ncbi:hypothetical protein TYRP_017498 [Tyrophagus putrescentiae]|nr:hypothetical protein TYRP_017498 [Tyrophagus putrescentiae]
MAELITRASPPTYVDFNNGNPRQSTIDLLFTNIKERLINHKHKTEVDSSMPRKHMQIHSSWQV